MAVFEQDDDAWRTALTVVQPLPMLYMASTGDIHHDACVQAGLEVFDPKFPPRAVLWRRIYVSWRFAEWTRAGLRSVVVSDSSQASAASQLNAELVSFCRGGALMVGQDFRCLEPTRDSIWELKTPDLRLFGWFICKNCMVLHAGGDANQLHGGKGWAEYEPYISDCVAYRNSLTPALPGPISGVKASDVVSNRAR